MRYNSASYRNDIMGLKGSAAFKGVQIGPSALSDKMNSLIGLDVLIP